LSPLRAERRLERRHSKGVRPRLHREGGSEVDGIDGVDRARPAEAGQNRSRAASRRTRTLLSFQGPMPGRAGNEKASAHARGLRFDGLRKWSYPNRAKTLL